MILLHICEEKHISLWFERRGEDKITLKITQLKNKKIF